MGSTASDIAHDVRSRRRTAVDVMALAACAIWVHSAAAQSSSPPHALEGAIGWAGFADEGIIHHTLAGGAWRIYVSRRISVGPEVQYMAGPRDDRDLIVTGNVVVDLLARTPARPRRTTPFGVVGGGLFRHSDTFRSGTYSSNEGAFTAGIGLRTWVGPRVFVAGDARIGWEPHLRLAATVGVTFP